MSRNIEVQEHHLLFKGPIQLKYSALDITHFCAIVMFQLSWRLELVPLSGNAQMGK